MKTWEKGVFLIVLIVLIVFAFLFFKGQNTTENLVGDSFSKISEYLFVNKVVTVLFAVVPLLIITLAIIFSKHMSEKTEKIDKEMYSIKEVYVTSLSKIFAFFSIIIYILIVAIMAILQKIYSVETSTYFTFNFLKFLYFIVIIGGFGALFGLITGYFYNLLAKKIGGIKIKLER